MLLYCTVKCYPLKGSQPVFCVFGWLFFVLANEGSFFIICVMGKASFVSLPWNVISMQEAELKKLLKLTAIELEPDQMPAFLDYFSSMKKMFDEFYDTPFGTVPRTSYEEGGEGDFVDGGNKTSPTPPYEGGK
jgi:hypothetical protein